MAAASWRTCLFARFLIICWNICYTIADQTVCSEYLVSGLYGVEDSALTASSIWWGNTTVWGAQNARLHFDGKFDTMGIASSWCADTHNSQQYIQVQFPRQTAVDAVVTQGRKDTRFSQWVETYYLMYSMDGITWTNVTSQNDQPKLFTGNSDRNTVVKSSLVPSITAVYLRINPRTFNEHVSLRFDVSGCYKVEETRISSDFFRLLPSTTFETDLLFEMKSNYLSACCQQCLQGETCLSFTFDKDQGLCRSFTSAFPDINATVSTEPSQFFVNKGIFTSLGFRPILNGIPLYRVSELSMNQTSATDLCMQQRSQLIRIDSEAEMFSLQNIISENTILEHGHYQLFVSGTYVSLQWEYNNGELINNDLWSPGNPNPVQGHCVMLAQTGLASVDCLERLFSVCGLY